MRVKPTVAPALWLVLLPFVFIPGGIGRAAGQASNSKLEAELQVCCGAREPDAEGNADHRKQIHKGRINQERFKAKVKIPIPSPELGISDASDAQNADIRMILSRNGTEVAECLLVLTETEEEFEDGHLEGVYKVDVGRQLKKRGYVLHEVHGSCNTDPGTIGGDPGVPAVQINDGVTATRVVSPADRSRDIDFLDGIFEHD